MHWAASSIVDISAVKMCAPTTNLTLATDACVFPQSYSSPMLNSYTDAVRQDLDHKFQYYANNSTQWVQSFGKTVMQTPIFRSDAIVETVPRFVV